MILSSTQKSNPVLPARHLWHSVQCYLRSRCKGASCGLHHIKFAWSRDPPGNGDIRHL